ncbi:Uncharacterised protein [Mycoplasmopsis glycophila]|uniref:Uncharacterized protein n=1 Tax=Mycoplasmopsis glycophila TaxID=171285 RepID=A0A449AVC8_9BACT|nr:Uncharacterised protein [Mycoplasmopsis glycophila]
MTRAEKELILAKVEQIKREFQKYKYYSLYKLAKERDKQK